MVKDTKTYFQKTTRFQSQCQYFVEIQDWSTRLVLSRSILLVGLNLMLTAAFTLIGLRFGPPFSNNRLLEFLQYAVIPCVLLQILQTSYHEGYAVLLLACLSSYLGYFTLSPISYYLHAQGLEGLLFQALGMTALVTFSIGMYAAFWGQTFKLAQGIMMALVPVVFIGGCLTWIFPSNALCLFVSSACGILAAWQLGTKLNQIVTGGETNAVRAATVLYISIYNLFRIILSWLIWLATANGSGSRRQKR